jgi:TM2 domain-containing membrane protein YozV
MIMDEKLDNDSIALLNLLTAKQKDYALTLYASREKKKSIAYILWCVIGLYYFYLGKPVKNILLWVLSACFVGVIWWFVDLFRISGMVEKKNREILQACIVEAQKLYPEAVPPVQFDGK